MLARKSNLPALPRLLAVFALCASVADVPAHSLRHKPAPPLVRTDLQGQRFDLAAFKGRVVLLTFWATWCGPCQVEMSHFVDWQSRYGPHGLQIVGVSMDDDEAPVRAMTQDRGVNYSVLLGDAELARSYGGIFGLPVTFLIDRKGRIVAKFKGETDMGAMERTVKHLLGAQ